MTILKHNEAQKTRRSSLAEMLVSTARNNWMSKAIGDSSGKQLSYGQTLTGALILKEQLEPKLSGEKLVGLLLPSSVGGVLANLALPLLNKVAVNLNYTASPEAVQSAIEQCSIKTVITGKRFIERFPQLPVAEQFLYLEELLAERSKADSLLGCQLTVEQQGVLLRLQDAAI